MPTQFPAVDDTPKSGKSGPLAWQSVSSRSTFLILLTVDHSTQFSAVDDTPKSGKSGPLAWQSVSSRSTFVILPYLLA